MKSAFPNLQVFNDPSMLLSNLPLSVVLLLVNSSNMVGYI